MTTPLLLSYRQAAKLLGVGGDRLRDLIRDNHLRPVKLYGESKIPREELERFAREGTSTTATPRPRAGATTSTTMRAHALAEVIGNIKI